MLFLPQTGYINTAFELLLPNANICLVSLPYKRYVKRVEMCAKYQTMYKSQSTGRWHSNRKVRETFSATPILYEIFPSGKPEILTEFYKPGRAHPCKAEIVSSIPTATDRIILMC